MHDNLISIIILILLLIISMMFIIIRAVKLNSIQAGTKFKSLGYELESC